MTLETRLTEIKKRLLCFIFGHKYVVALCYSKTTRLVLCKRCRQAWLMNDKHQVFFEWDYECKELSKWAWETGL